MKHFKIRIAALGLAAACWGIMFPEYTYTADSYAVLYEDGTDTEDHDHTPQDILKAAREGKVRYRFKLFDFLQKSFWGTAAGK